MTLDPERLQMVARRIQVMRRVTLQIEATSPPPTERHVTEALDGMVRNMRPTNEVAELEAIAALCIRRLMELEQT